MPPLRKNWVFRAGIDNPKFAASTHSFSCTSCHGGVDGNADKNAAHAGMQKIPGAKTCETCHAEKVALAADSLHTTVSGFEAVLSGRGFNFTPGTTSQVRFTKQCAKCHLANTSNESACGHCHVSVPDSAGGGLIAGHRMNRTPSTDNNCTACHGSRVKDEYYGQNQALFTRNLSATGVPEAYPFRATPLQPDVHKARGMGCEACHTPSEMHGAGAAAEIDRYGITGRTQCLTCHAQLSSNAFHTSKHVETMSCHVCHSQPYKQCYGCHTQETTAGAAYFTNNESDPTRFARTAPAWSASTTYAKDVFVTFASATYKSLQAANLGHQPDEASSAWWVAAVPTKLIAGDALITFRIGNNPKFGQAGAKKYAVVRHVPIDADTFKYTIEGVQVPGLVPNVTGLPTWKFATPHNIQRVTKITTDPDGAGDQTACGNCHSARYSSFWLTDAIGDSFGWVPAGATWEATANQNVVKAAPIAPAIP